MTGLLALLALVLFLGIVYWAVNCTRWGKDTVPPSARQWDPPPDPEWEPWAYLDFPTPPDVPALPAPRPATYWVGEPEQLPAPRPQIGPGGR